MCQVARMFEEVDYELEGRHAELFAELYGGSNISGELCLETCIGGEFLGCRRNLTETWQDNVSFKVVLHFRSR